MQITITVNGAKRELEVTPYTRLLDLLREDLGLTGVKEGCGKGECGACTVIMNGELTASCLVPAPQADQAEIVTVEGLGTKDDLHPIQESFVEAGAVQCGYCIPGMVLASKRLLDEKPKPTEKEVRYGLSGNICRCTGYAKIIDAVMLAADKLAVEGSDSND
ncbi:(2Fe-2S)-binding protein [Halanaerobium saccharolyticum]|jgi:carbon-monoxide dehydrogenase small subunit|uniref:Purine hydroxylase delta subunit apoprotein n=1 Tax=Halanaerobium saccharolyticum TaxID=43595 RepID=A0A2T5RQE7_9FIRM|nr:MULTISPECIES: (2Fe-2S)-binding protein [Halanaerobium]PTW02211.1 purine hydroxylase delta subunit apoprotein [Halanaerobium saccharolyticum]PUU91217.1 MAG: carbon-monoxide dehydrogenase small subunit [Halanaerobium sp.]PUU95609.1 MAG: carbon-monoxide dehydrogenase small subunit [Halanaerobium sp.]